MKEKTQVYACARGKHRSVKAWNNIPGAEMIIGGINGLFREIRSLPHQKQANFIKQQYSNCEITIINDGNVGREMQLIIDLLKETQIPYTLISTVGLDKLIDSIHT